MADQVDKVINDTVKGMSGIPGADRDYVIAGRWRCDMSPTHAHHWIEDTSEEQGVFVCRYCGKRKKFQIIYSDRKQKVKEE